MKISIACDHGAYELKERLKAHLTQQGHEVTDCGTDSLESWTLIHNGPSRRKPMG